jgi:Flp pilus assembly protein TadG
MRRFIFLRDERASAAVEFALVVPVLFALILGIISTSTMYYSQASMHQAAEWAARYWAVSDAGFTISSSCTFSGPVGDSSATLPVGCTSANTVGGTTYIKPATYAQQHYLGANITGLTFTPTTGICTASGTIGPPGMIVTATGTYNFNVMFLNIPVSMYTQACYPLIQ